MFSSLRSSIFRLPMLAATFAVLSLPAAAARNDYPTYERVQYAVQCMSSHSGGRELIYQCSCALDKLAEQFSIDDFVHMQTAVNAMTMTGERGGEVRDNPSLRDAAKRYRQAEQEALASCGATRR
jgi:hypothetical protein